MSPLAFRWFGACLLLACSAPEDTNPAPRCEKNSDCEPALSCYRTFCLERDDEGLPIGDGGGWTVPDDISRSAAGDGGSGTATSPGAGSEAIAAPAITAGASTAGATAPPAATPDGTSGAKAASSGDAATAPSTSAPPATTMEPVEPAATPTPGSTMPTGAADGGTLAPHEPQPTTEPSGAQERSLLEGLIATGLAPAALVSCVPACALGLGERECQKCIDRLLKEAGQEGCEPPSQKDASKGNGKDDDKEDDDDDDDDDKDDDKEDGNGRDTQTLCTLTVCPKGGCGRGS